jgi:predicted nucleic acid-binding protein
MANSLARKPGIWKTRWRGFADRPTALPKIWMDAYLAAYAVTAGCRLVTTDSVFRQFEGLDLTLIE